MNSKWRLTLIYLCGFLIAIHYASVAYVNSSMLTQIVGEGKISLFFILGSILSICSLILAPYLLKKCGSIMTFLLFITIEIIAVFGIGILNSAFIVIIFFLLHQGAGSMLSFNLDLNLEQEIKKEGTTGSKRGIFFTVQNLAWIFAPLALSVFIIDGMFDKIYLLSGLALIPLFLLVGFFFKDIVPTHKHKTDIRLAFMSLLKGGDKVRIISSQFILSVFYSWMIIFLPLLLNKEMGFSWEQIGLLLPIMLLPFLLFELPAGILGDKKIGEKELLVVGFLIMFISTSIIPLIEGPIFFTWAIILFLTRTGASLVEISSESYFFKHVKEVDVGLISLFRMTRPLSFIVVPLITIPITHYFSYSTSFYFLAFIVLAGLLFIPKVDTK